MECVKMVGRRGVAMRLQTAASIICRSLKFLELHISTFCVRSAKLKHEETLGKCALSPLLFRYGF